MAEGDEERALEVLDYIIKKVPNEVVPYDMTALDYVSNYLATGSEEKANEVLNTLLGTKFRTVPLLGE